MPRQPTMDVQFINKTAVVANLYKTDRLVQAGVRKAVREGGNGALNMSRDICPVSEPGDYAGAGQQRLKKSITLRFSPDNLVWEIFSDDAKFVDYGKYYAPYVEFVHSPFLRPAFEEWSPRTRNLVVQEVRAALRRQELELNLI